MGRRHGTDEELTPPDRGGPRLALACVGSPQNGFADAGKLFELEGVTSVSFTRGAQDSSLDVSGEDHGLNLAIGLPYVSNVHARIALAFEGGEHAHTILDCGSRNGTFVDGTRIEAPTRLTPGDVFEIGRSFWALVEMSLREDTEAIASISPEGAVNGPMRGLLTALGRVASSTLPLLLTGETGVGKDRLAEAVHRASGVTGDFVAVNVMTGSFERLLFGSTTDGGLVQRARNGTLFLDDVGELDRDAQTKLQSALMSYAPSIGADRGHNDVRVIAASTRDIRSMVSQQGFRPDLMARLAGFEGYVPALRERREDLGILVRTMARRSDGQPVPMMTSVFREIVAHHWSFNVRELEHAIAAAVAMAANSADGIDTTIWRAVAGPPRAEEDDPVRIQAVREALVQYLVVHAGDTRAVAESMHCRLQDVDRWLDRLSLEPEAYGRAG